MGLKIPTIGAWYFDYDEHQLFEVVAIDDEHATVEVQYLDGAIGEFDLDTWPQLNLVSAAPPEDSDAAYELSQEDRWHDDHTMALDFLGNPLNHIEPDFFPGYDEF